jgi:superfamily II DNA or RNA helicase
VALRGYQREAIDALGAGWGRGLQRLGISLPTGVGKTHIMIEASRLATQYGHRVLWLLHRDTLVEQSVTRLVDSMRRWTKRPSVGVVKARRNQPHAQLVIASVHTLRNEKRLTELAATGRFGLIIVDEAHVSVSDTYLKAYDALGAFDPAGPRMAGFTATWTRSDKRGLGDVWQEIVYQRGIRWAIENDFLVKPQGKKVGDDLDLSSVRTTAGDWNEHDLAELVMVDDLRDTVVKGWFAHARGRHTVLFAPTIESSEFFMAAFREAGIGAEGVYATTKATARRDIFDRAKPGGPTLVLGTCTALAEGWDAPWFSCAALVRPTKHRGLYVQKVGRVLRPSPETGKVDALVLDFVSTTDGMTLDHWPELELSPPPADELEDDELEDDEEKPAPEPLSVGVRRIRGVHEVDLFGDSPIRWQLTDGGVAFVSAGDWLYFLMRQAGGWQAAYCSTRRGLASGETIGAVGDLEYARYAIESHLWDNHLADRAAGWRNKGNPSAQQKNFARKVGLSDIDGMSRGELSDAINVAVANRILSTIQGAITA